MIINDEDTQLFNQIIKKHSDYDFTNYSDKSLKRRIAKLLGDYHLDMDGLVKRIQKDPNFIEEIVREITVNTSELFRDPEIWHDLRFRILPKYQNQDSINIWHAGCSQGQEVYSMLILLHELGLFDKARVYASDINTKALEKARSGQYKYRFNIGYLDNFDKAIKENPFNYEEYNDIPYSKYFQINEKDDLIIMNDFLRTKPKFKTQDLVQDKNLFHVKFDIILCRNVVIYFNYTLQNHLFRYFYKHLTEGGHLMLGKQETLRGELAPYFEKFTHAYIKKSR